MTKNNKKKNFKSKKSQVNDQLENFPGVFYGLEDRRPDKLIKKEDDIKNDLISK